MKVIFGLQPLWHQFWCSNLSRGALGGPPKPLASDYRRSVYMAQSETEVVYVDELNAAKYINNIAKFVDTKNTPNKFISLNVWQSYRSGVRT